MKSRFLLLAFFSASCALMGHSQQVVFNFTGGSQTWVVPTGVTSIAIDARGGMGGGNAADPLVLGGKGGRVQTTIAVTPGETLTIYVAGLGGDPTPPNTAGLGGFNGGGTGGIDNVDGNGPAAGGGGASDVRQGGDDLAHRVVVAGGGGGAECCEDANGGAGRGLIGANGSTPPEGGSTGGGGGTQANGGAAGTGCNGIGTSGNLGQGGTGGDGNRAGGGGGGGFYGAGGGGGCTWGSGGGGGSSYSVGTGTIHTQGYQSGNGQVIITFGTTSPVFLNFPLLNRNAFDAKIISVFDHSSNWQYCSDNSVEADDGEKGQLQNGTDSQPTDPTCFLTGLHNLAYGFAQNSTYQAFSVNGQYVGADGDGNGHPGIDFLQYDGHPGYDFETKDQSANGKIPVLAAAAGTVVCSNVPSSPKCSNATTIDPCIEGPGEIKIRHSNGYFSIYLHLSSSSVTPGETVSAQQQIGVSGDTGVCNNPHLHFEIRKGSCGNSSSCTCSRAQTTNVNNCIPVDPYGWSDNIDNDPYTHDGKPVVNVNLWK
jgi:murein DD-endopeptidase MepM/ murein hydrolase activator NlpD